MALVRISTGVEIVARQEAAPALPDLQRMFVHEVPDEIDLAREFLQ